METVLGKQGLVMQLDEKTPLVAIYMITYNHEEYIAQAVESVLMQKTDFYFHLFIGDDCSTDSTTRICNKLQKTYPENITLYTNKKNLGATKNALNIFNACFNSKAKYIAMLEGDDYWTDSLKLQKQVDFLEAHPEYAICFHRANVLRDDSTSSLHQIPDSANENVYEYKDLLKNGNFITTASVVYRNPKGFSFPNWFTKTPFGDMALYHLLSKNKKIVCLDEVMSVYRIHSEGIYSKLSQIQKQQNFLTFYKILYPHLTEENKAVVTKKLKKKQKKLAKLKYPNSKLMRWWYMHFNKVLSD